MATATTATVQADGSWQTLALRQHDVRRRAHRVRRTRTAASFHSTVGGDFLALTVSSPRQLETRVLWNLIRHLKQNDLDATEQEFAFWSRIARTAAILFATLLAVPFVFGSLRSAGAGARTLLGVLIGVTVLSRAANARKRRRGVRREPGGARLGARRPC